MPRSPGGLKNDHPNKVAKAELTAAPGANHPVAVDYVPLKPLAPAGEVRLCTNFTEFTRSFGGFSVDVTSAGGACGLRVLQQRRHPLPCRARNVDDNDKVGARQACRSRRDRDSSGARH